MRPLSLATAAVLAAPLLALSTTATSAAPAADRADRAGRSADHSSYGDRADGADGDPTGVVLDWYDVTTQAVATLASPVQAPSSAVWATAWSAADLALQRGEVRGPFRRAAFAQALHDALVDEVPAAQGSVDAALQRTLAGVPAGKERDRAVRLGERAARDVVRSRVGDGLTVADVNTAYTPHGGAGYWVTTTPGAPAIQASLGEATPFVLRDLPDVPAPPALGSATYRRDLTEVREYGARTGSLRSPEQTAVAQFWGQSSLAAYTQVVRGVLAQERDTALRDRVHLVAVFHEVTTDVQIATYAAKYRYERWRPLTAIREADLDGRPISDGDPTTTPDPTWTPLITTPLHPEYPAGHVSYAAAAAEVLTALVGPTADQPITVTSSTAPGAARTYRDWLTLRQENLDGRVWEGVHFRFSGDRSILLGTEVAREALRRLGD